jgi:hypothetical protein
MSCVAQKFEPFNPFLARKNEFLAQKLKILARFSAHKTRAFNTMF